MITDYGGPLGQAIYSSTQIKAQLSTLTAQASSGYVSDSYAGLGAAAQTPLSLAPQIADLAARQTAIDTVSGHLDVTQTALTQIGTIVNGLYAQFASLNTVAPSQIDGVAQNARSSLQQVADLLNTTDGSVYVFGGTDSATAPVPNAASILSSPFFTTIGTAVSGLALNGAAATAASTLAVASSDSAGVTPFSGPPGQPPTIALGDGAPVQVGVLANANSFAVSGGTATTGSYIRDILRALATVGSLSSSQATAPGFTALVQDTGASLSNAITAFGTEQGALGDIETTLQSQKTQAANIGTALSSQVSSTEDVDIVKTLTDLSQVQTQLTASYKLIAETSKLSLVDFL